VGRRCLPRCSMAVRAGPAGRWPPSDLAVRERTRDGEVRCWARARVRLFAVHARGQWSGAFHGLVAPSARRWATGFAVPPIPGAKPLTRAPAWLNALRQAGFRNPGCGVSFCRPTMAQPTKSSGQPTLAHGVRRSGTVVDKYAIDPTGDGQRARGRTKILITSRPGLARLPRTPRRRPSIAKPGRQWACVKHHGSAVRRADPAPLGPRPSRKRLVTIEPLAV